MCSAAGDGDDDLEGGAGADVLNGGGGDDRAAYWRSDAGVTVDLAAGTARGGHADGDTLTGIEDIGGSGHADRLTGDNGDNTLQGAGGDDELSGGDGDDWLEGHVGADVLDGGAGEDGAAYWGSDAGVTVNLDAGTASGGHADGDVLTGIERIDGSRHADHLIGGAGRNTFYGGDGNDSLDGGAGSDWLQGGAGDDTFVFGDGDTISDFGNGADRIDLSGHGDISADNFETSVTIRQSGDNVEVDIGGSVLTLTGVSAADISADDFLFA